MNKKRLFIAINLPENIKNKISDIVAGLDAQMDKKVARQMGFRWLPPDNWHLTISFLGLQSDESIPDILRALKETAKSFSAPEIKFENIIFAPSGKSPRMIWMSGAEQTSRMASDIKNALEDLLIENRVRFKPEARKYNAHLTLARFASGTSIDDLNIDLKNVSKTLCRQLDFTARSIDLMESESKRNGVEYFSLAEEKFS